MNRKIALLTLITILATTLPFMRPRIAQADILDGVSVASCDLYAATIAKAKKWLEDQAKKLLGKGTDKAKDEAAGLINKEAKDKLGIDIGLSNDTKVPVRAQDLEKQTQKSAEEIVANQVRTTCKESVKKFILTTLKKRILDHMADQIVAWIQNGKTPQFLDQPGKFLQRAGSEAVGDVALEIAPFLCTPFRASIQIGLMEPGPFAQKARCTLNTISSTIHGFAKSFQTAGWIGYNEVIKPQNNRWGSELLAQDEVFRRVQAEVRAAEVEVTMNQGYFGSKRCLKWTFIDLNRQTAVTRVTSRSVPDRNYVIGDPKNLPLLNDVLQNLLPPGSTLIPAEQTAKELGGPREDFLGYAWKCLEREITTPGRLVGDVLTKGITSDVDYVINADDLSDYLGSFIDAGISRIVTGSKGKGGIKGGIKDLYATKDNPPRGQLPRNSCDSYKKLDNGVLKETPLSKACEQSLISSRDFFTISKENLLALLDQAEDLASTTESTIKKTAPIITNILATVGNETDTQNTSLLGCLKTLGDAAGVENYKNVATSTETIIKPFFAQKGTENNQLKSAIAVERVRVNNLFNESTATERSNEVMAIHSEAETRSNSVESEFDALERMEQRVKQEFDTCKANLGTNNP